MPNIGCAHCQTAIEGSVGTLPGVSSVAVDITAKLVTVEGTFVQEAVEATLSELGYEIAARA